MFVAFMLPLPQGSSLTLTGVIVHGFGVFLYIADEGMATGASWTVETAFSLEFQQVFNKKHELRSYQLKGGVVLTGCGLRQ